MKQGVRSVLSSGALLWLVVVLGPPLLGVILYVFAGSHQILPGMTGCKFVRDASIQIDCYADVFKDYRSSHSVNATLEWVSDQAKGNSSVTGACHLALHQLGEPDGSRAGKAKKTFTAFDDAGWCAEGYIHGFYIGYLAEVGTGAKSAQLVSEVCGGLPKPEATYNCSHSFGHSMARTTPSRAKASKGCDALAFESSDVEGKAKRDCFYGMFMEYTLNDLAKGRTKPLNDCKGIPDSAKQGCYAFLPGRVERMTGSREEAAKACDRYAPEGELRDLCIGSFARSITKPEDCDPLETPEEQALCREKPDVTGLPAEG